MSFDIEPDGDPHGECALEIKTLKAELERKQGILKKEIMNNISTVNDAAGTIADLGKEVDRLRAENQVLRDAIQLKTCSNCPYNLEGVSEETKQNWLKEEKNGHPCHVNLKQRCAGNARYEALTRADEIRGENKIKLKTEMMCVTMTHLDPGGPAARTKEEG